METTDTQGSAQRHQSTAQGSRLCTRMIKARWVSRPLVKSHNYSNDPPHTVSKSEQKPRDHCMRHYGRPH
eukprot:1866342-Amphidinium_carterae.1